MKTTTLLVVAGVGVGGFLLWKRFAPLLKVGGDASRIASDLSRFTGAAAGGYDRIRGVVTKGTRVVEGVSAAAGRVEGIFDALLGKPRGTDVELE